MKPLLAGVLIVIGCSNVASQTYADWAVQKIDNDEAYVAATVNSTGGALGRLCSADGCIWAMTLGASCEDGSTYPALMSTPNGAFHVTLRCSPNDKVVGRYVFEDYAQANTAISGAGTVGVAFAMANGDFRVSRFSLRGLEAATSQLKIRLQTLQRPTGERRL